MDIVEVFGVKLGVARLKIADSSQQGQIMMFSLIKLRLLIIDYRILIILVCCLTLVVCCKNIGRK